MGTSRSFEPDNCYDIPSWIEAGKELAISRDTLMLKTRKGEVISPMQHLVCRYYYALVPFIVEQTLTDDEFMVYKNNPKKLSQDLYGTPELWFVIMYINNMVSVTEFKKQKLKLFSSNIITYLEELMVIAEDDLSDNQLEVEDK